MKVTIQKIFGKFGKAFLKKHKVSTEQKKAMDAISKCRTQACGSHYDECDDCGNQIEHFNSCKNRNCPQCQTFKQECWINDRKAEVLGTSYYHVVFTIPKELHLLAMYNKKQIYSLMFRASAKAIKILTQDKKHLGACTGFMSVLHTWGQSLDYHPHIHMIVTGGGLTKEKKWKEGSNKFFVPVKKLSAVFRRIFLEELKEMYASNDAKKKLEFFNDLKMYENPREFQRLIDELFKLSWYTYVKKPFKGPDAVIEYLARYTHRVAISNYRLVKVEGGRVFFKYKDYKNKNNKKVMSLEVEEFIRRFLLHVLPSGFVKIRAYGIMANINKKTKLVVCRKITGVLNNNKYVKLTKKEVLEKILKNKVIVCPECGSTSLTRLGEWNIKNTS